MYRIPLFLIIVMLLTTVSCKNENSQTESKQRPYTIAEELLFDDFSSDSQLWLAEGIEPKLTDGMLELDSPTGSTIWLIPSLQGNVLIEYDVTIPIFDEPVAAQTRLGCFFMAADPADTNNMFTKSQERKGDFQEYSDLNLYYLGLGCGENSSMQLTKYNKGDYELLAECADVSLSIEHGKKYRIQLFFYGNTIELCGNEKALFCTQDLEPYTQGHFGLTAVGHVLMDNFKITHLRRPET
ncbi:DUF6250 domain-containing protein [Planctomycetota bacterium]